MTKIISEFESFGESLADASGKIVLNYWRSDLEVIHKEDESPVTRADREVEAKIRELIEARYPDHGIAGEEYGCVRMDAEYIWSLDPIDGTKAFISGSPLFGTLIALLRNGKPVLGIVDIPATSERWVGGQDLPAKLNGRPVVTRKGRLLSDATVGSTSPKMFVGMDAERVERVHERVGLPIFGGDCYLYGMLTLGSIDLVIEAGMSDYDYLAPAAMVEAAGGIMTGWQGETLGLGTTDRVVAAGDAKLHAEVISILNGD
ncbi:MAG: histidinol phosphate phosphatase [Rhodospirillaceae bacterium]|nr:histidinol phosphate phosphatase [Rhodospirillaceae bacterium]|tara:strand:+ start:3409 stop:4188 length:780 start_codon:yes stop_codon:yes gene_type:complete